MAEKHRWTVTYTKHIKQKRKVYHDGFLDLQISCRKVRLHDEAGNLLESRILKTDEAVSSGETLTFQAYLVDIGDPEGTNTTTSDLNVQPSDQRCNRRSFAALRPSFNKSSRHPEERKPNLANKIPATSFSPSHKMIRVFKKSQMQKYATPSPDGVKPKTKGAEPLGPADKVASSSNDHPLINISNDSSFETELGKSVPSDKPLRDVNQILSILRRPAAADKCYHNNSQTSESSTKAPPRSDKSYKMEPLSSNASEDQKIIRDTDVDSSQFPEPESSSGGPYVCSNTHFDDLPTFDLGI